jgi:pimeloyl-ACP methyl ester carboxylesterase
VILLSGVDLGGLFGRFNARPIEELAHVVADRIEQLADDLRCERIDLVGHSEGGQSAGGSAAPAAPLLVQMSGGVVKHAGLENMVTIVRFTPPDIRSSRSRSAGEEDSTLKGDIRSDLLLIASTAPPSPPSRELVCGSVA